MEIRLQPIGIIHSPHHKQGCAPVQPRYAQGVRGHLEIFAEFAEGLRDLDGFSHIMLVYHLHRSRGYSLLTVPHRDTCLRGVFATRSPHRPNPIGISVVRLLSIENNIVRISDIDAFDETPLLDIKPFIPEFSSRDEIKLGWIDGKIS